MAQIKIKVIKIKVNFTIEKVEADRSGKFILDFVLDRAAMPEGTICKSMTNSCLQDDR